MSYLEPPRIVLAGRFISDVSTINNDTAHFDPNVEPSDLGWNPRGGATFDFCNCNVTGAAGSSGNLLDTDPVLALAVSGAVDRPSGKMVDLDPDWQMSSEIWGLRVRLFDPATREVAFEGTFGVAPFRDLFTRQLEQAIAGAIPNQQPSGGRFVSILKNVEWGPVAARSPLLQELKAVTVPGELSIVLNTFGYYYSHVDGRHATGALVGCIGPRNRGEPQTFIAARRLQSLALPMPGGRPLVLVGPAEAIVSPAGRASIDVGHALLISDTDGAITDISRIGTALAGMQALAFGCLPEENINSGDRLAAGVATVFGEIDYLAPGWYKKTGGVVSIDITAEQTATAASRPLALFARMQDNTHLVLNRETSDGLYVRADNFVQRLDPGGWAHIDFYARRRGLPAGNQTIHIALSGAAANTPAGAIGFQNSIVTNADGKALLHVAATDPGNVRPKVDGQIYALGYSPRLGTDGKPSYTATGLNLRFDVVVVHIRSAFPVPERPEWHRDIKPIMASYAQLYPIMSRHLFDLGDYKVMTQHRKHLLLAFERPVDDPNYMPVTRDLSDNKRATILRWLRTETGDPDEPLVKGVLTPPGPIVEAVVRRTLAPITSQAQALGEDDIKRAMAKLFAQDTEAVLPITPESDS